MTTLTFWRCVACKRVAPSTPEQAADHDFASKAICPHCGEEWYVLEQVRSAYAFMTFDRKFGFWFVQSGTNRGDLETRRTYYVECGEVLVTEIVEIPFHQMTGLSDG